MSNTLKSRIDDYQSRSSHKLLPKLPVIIIISGRGFTQLTSLLDKPFSLPLAKCFYATMKALMQQIEGAVFGYTANDEIVIVCRNDQSLNTNPWFDNDPQRISSAVASMATLFFNREAGSRELFEGATFIVQTFVVPNIPEAINVLVCKQQGIFAASVSLACFYELLKSRDRDAIKQMLTGLSIDDKIDLLYQELGIDFEASYPTSFRRGAACYYAPKIVLTDNDEEIVEDVLIINDNLPIFTKDHSLLGGVFSRGKDILRDNLP
jgi:tRNA(His) 5'-end guanylyltransferase